MDSWNSVQYLKFQNERTQPAYDLAARIPAIIPDKIVDIGCGPGNSTKVLAERFPGAKLIGIDSSENMISAAKKEYPSFEFAVCDAGSKLETLGNDFSVVFSNACIQWIPDHPLLIKNMFSLLKSGGVLAVQIPMNFEEPIHKIISEVSGSDKWKGFFHDARVFYTLSPNEYFDILAEQTDNFRIWQTVYYHVMDTHHDILEWYRSTGLRPYLNALSGNTKTEFENDIMAHIKKSYPAQKNGKIIFRFPRFFFVAVRR